MYMRSHGGPGEDLGPLPTARLEIPREQEILARILRAVEQELDRKLTADDVMGLHRRRLRLRELFDAVPECHARILYDRLRREDDPLAQRFRHRLATATRSEMMSILLRNAASQPFCPPTLRAVSRPSEIEEQIRAMDSRLPTKDDRKEGRKLLDIALKDAHWRAKNYASLDFNWLGEVLKGAELVEKGAIGLEVFGVLEKLGLFGSLAPVGLAVAGMVGFLYELGEANRAKDIAKRRWTYYSAYASGMAAGLDPNYRPVPPKNPILRYAYDVGYFFTRPLSPIQQRQMAAELIMRCSTLVGPRSSVEFYLSQRRGDVLKNFILGCEFSRNEYLIR